jgi:hypothetical protein
MPMSKKLSPRAGAMSSAFAFALLAGVAPQVLAQTTEPPANVRPQYALNVESCYRDWLKAEGRQDGLNKSASGSILFVASGEAQVNADKANADQWLAARGAAFSQAELGARENLAIFLRAELKEGGRIFEAMQAGGEPMPPMIDAAAKQLSLSDKALTLAGAQLDAAIKEFKPDWDGTGRSEDQRKGEALKIQTRMREQISQYSRVFVSGAFTAMQCEGPNSDGRYSVTTALIWSPALTQIAQSVVNPAYTPPPAKPQMSLSDRFAQLSKENPDWMAMTQGVRVWTDETGARVVVGFGTVAATSQASIDASRARTRALAAIQYFVAEQIESDNKENVDFAYRETTGGEQSFNNSLYQQKIAGRTKAVSLQGSQTLAPWRTNHPWSNARLTTVAVKWTAEGRQAAGEAMEQMRKAAEPAAPARAGAQGGPVRSGASSSTNDF